MKVREWWTLGAISGALVYAAGSWRDVLVTVGIANAFFLTFDWLTRPKERP